MSLKIFGFLAAAIVAFFAAGSKTVSANDDYPAVIAAQEGAVRLQPSSPWNIHFAEENCRLSRVFGEGENKHLLFFEQTSPSDSFSMTIAGPAFAKFGNPRRVELGMPSDQVLQRQPTPYLGDVETMGRALIYTSINPAAFSQVHTSNDTTKDDEREAKRAAIDLEEAAKIERIVTRSGKRVVSIETDELAPAFQALNACTRDLLQMWGLDPTKLADAEYTPARAIGLRQIVRRIQQAYPSAALRRGQQAFFRMRMIVEIDGTVSECYLDKATKADSLDSPACQEFLRAKFEPALDADGQPIRSFYSTGVTYLVN